MYPDDPSTLESRTGLIDLAQLVLGIAEAAAGQRSLLTEVGMSAPALEFVGKIEDELVTLAESMIRDKCPVTLDAIVKAIQHSFADTSPETLRDVRKNLGALSAHAADGIARRLREALGCEEATAKAWTAMFGQGLLVELSKPAYLRAAEAEAGRRGTTARKVLDEDAEEYRRGIESAFEPFRAPLR